MTWHTLYIPGLICYIKVILLNYCPEKWGMTPYSLTCSDKQLLNEVLMIFTGRIINVKTLAVSRLWFIKVLRLVTPTKTVIILQLTLQKLILIMFCYNCLKGKNGKISDGMHCPIEQSLCFLRTNENALNKV